MNEIVAEGRPRKYLEGASEIIVKQIVTMISVMSDIIDLVSIPIDFSTPLLKYKRILALKLYLVIFTFLALILMGAACHASEMDLKGQLEEIFMK